MCHLKRSREGTDHPRAEHVAGDPYLPPRPIGDRGLPLAGRIAAGVLHEAIEQEDRVDFKDIFDPSNKDLFVLEVNGDSIDRGPNRPTATMSWSQAANRPQGADRRGIDGRKRGNAKRWFPEKNRIRLEPANSSMKPIFVKNAKVLGLSSGGRAQVQVRDFSY